MLDAHAILEVILAAEIGIECPVLQDSKQGVGIGADISLAEARSGWIASRGLARRRRSTHPRDIHSSQVHRVEVLRNRGGNGRVVLAEAGL